MTRQMAARRSHLQLALRKIWPQSVGNSSRESPSCELAKLCLLEACARLTWQRDRQLSQMVQTVAPDPGSPRSEPQQRRCLRLQVWDGRTPRNTLLASEGRVLSGWHGPHSNAHFALSNKRSEGSWCFCAPCLSR